MKSLYKNLTKIFFKISFLINRLRIKKNQKLNSKNLKICIFHTLNIGDTIVLTPSINYLKKIYTDLYIICSNQGYKVLKGILPEENIFIYNNKIIEYIKLIKKLRKLKFDIIYDFHNSFFTFREFFFIYFVSKKKTIRIGFLTKYYKAWLLDKEIIWNSEEKHEVDTYFDLVCKDALDVKSFYLYLNKQKTKEFENKFEKIGKNLNKKYIVIHACSSNERKLWIPERFAKLAEILSEKYNYYIIFTGLEKEKQIVDKIFSYIKNKNNILNFCSQILFEEYCFLISNAELLISIDTSAIHIATVTQTKTVAIFGSTNNIVWRPYNKNIQKIIQYELPCYPCEINFITYPCINNLECLKKISINDVIKQVELLLDVKN